MQRHSSQQDATPPVSQATSPRHRGLVLCIDDEASGLTVRKLILEAAGYDVATCLDGEKGLKTFSATPVRIVVLDYAMPGLDGVQVARAMRQIKPHVPILMLSAYPDPPEGSAVLVDVYLVKSEGPEFLLSKLQQLLV